MVLACISGPERLFLPSVQDYASALLPLGRQTAEDPPNPQRKPLMELSRQDAERRRRLLAAAEHLHAGGLARRTAL